MPSRPRSAAANLPRPAPAATQKWIKNGETLRKFREKIPSEKTIGINWPPKISDGLE